MREQTIEEVQARVARTIASRYARRCWWADEADLTQEAWRITLEVARQMAPDGTTIDLEVFARVAWVACMRQLSRWLWRQSSPVTASDHGVVQTRGARRVSFEVADASGSGEESGEGPLERVLTDRTDGGPAYQAPATDVVEMRLLLERFRTRVRAVLGADLAELALDLTLGDESPAEAAARRGIRIRQAYKATELLVARTREDRELSMLARQMARASGMAV